MSPIPNFIENTWPLLRRWPVDVGPLPSMNNVTQAAMLVRRGTAVHMALAMYMRESGSTDVEAAEAATAATGARSKTHRVKRDELIRDGELRRQNLGQRKGKLVVRVAMK